MQQPAHDPEIRLEERVIENETGQHALDGVVRRLPLRRLSPDALPYSVVWRDSSWALVRRRFSSVDFSDITSRKRSASGIGDEIVRVVAIVMAPRLRNCTICLRISQCRSACPRQSRACSSKMVRSRPSGAPRRPPAGASIARAARRPPCWHGHQRHEIVALEEFRQACRNQAPDTGSSTGWA